MKKVIALFLVLGITMSLILTSCGGNNTTVSESIQDSSMATNTAADTNDNQYGDTGGLKLPITDKPVVISWMLPSDVQDLSDKLVIQEINNRLGIKLDIVAVPTASYKDKVNITIASGKLNDITTGLSAPNVLGAQGALVAINKYVDMLPNFKKLYVDTPENSWALKSYGDTEGNLYQWLMYDLSRKVNRGWMYRKDVFDKNGIKAWTNADEFYAALKKLKEIYPESTPYVNKAKEQIFYLLACDWGIYSETWPACYNFTDEKWEIATTSLAYKAELDFLKKLYNEGLLDPEFLTSTQLAFEAKLTADDQAFVANDWIGWMQAYYNSLKDKKPDYDLRYANPVGPSGKVLANRKISYMGIGIANNDRKEVTLKLLDYLSSPSGSELVTIGIENKNVTIDNNKPVYPEFSNKIVTIKDLESSYGSWVQGMYIRPDHRSVYYNFTPNEQEAQDMVVNGNKLSPLPDLLTFTPEESEIRTEYESMIMKAGEQFSAKYVMDKTYGDKEWNEWVESVNRMGAKSYLFVFNTAQKRYDAMK